MKRMAILLLLALPVQAASAQGPSQLFETGRNSTHRYVLIEQHTARVFQVGTFGHKAGFGPGFVQIDTLALQPNGTFSNGVVQISRTTGKLQLHLRNKKNFTGELTPAANPAELNNTLRHAAFLGQYMDAAQKLQQMYPLTRIASWSAYGKWDAFPAKQGAFAGFQATLDRYLQHFSDSIHHLHQPYTATYQYILQNLGNMAVEALRDSIRSLPVERGYPHFYFANIVDTLARHHPARFFPVAAALSETERETAFEVIEYNTKVVKALRFADGPAETKRAFFSRQYVQKFLGTRYSYSEGTNIVKAHAKK